MSILLDEKTAVLITGITGREGQLAAQTMKTYGTNVVAGVTPGRGGQDVEGIPVYNSVAAATAKHKIDAALIYVPPASAADSIIEAAEAGIYLVVAITERIPLHEASRALAVSKEKGSLVVGPNGLGIITPGKAKIGTIGGKKESRSFVPGPVGVISRSGGMTTETAWMVKKAGYGCSTCISCGGDYLIGAGFADLALLFEDDPETKAIVIFCEPGAGYENELSAAIANGLVTKPVIAYIAGSFTTKIKSEAKFGHAGALLDKDCSYEAIEKRFKEVGVLVAEQYDDIIPLVQKVLQ
ncbi:MAG: CoA-binding protein [Desulfovibrio sp.]|jgi:succinyl-CoA synthetase alpha subunit|nr:CoA-binding protein [Desulfovibrio sp.]